MPESHFYSALSITHCNSFKWLIFLLLWLLPLLYFPFSDYANVWAYIPSYNYFRGHRLSGMRARYSYYENKKNDSNGKHVKGNISQVDSNNEQVMIQSSQNVSIPVSTAMSGINANTNMLAIPINAGIHGNPPDIDVIPANNLNMQQFQNGGNFQIIPVSPTREAITTDTEVKKNSNTNKQLFPSQIISLTPGGSISNELAVSPVQQIVAGIDTNNSRNISFSPFFGNSAVNGISSESIIQAIPVGSILQQVPKITRTNNNGGYPVAMKTEISDYGNKLPSSIGQNIGITLLILFIVGIIGIAGAYVYYKFIKNDDSCSESFPIIKSSSKKL